MAKKKYTSEQLQKVRNLIIAEKSNKEITAATAVLSGTISHLRKEMKNEAQLDVASETKSLEVLVQELRAIQAAEQAKILEITNCVGRGKNV